MEKFTLCSVMFTSISASVNICKMYRGATAASAYDTAEYDHRQTIC